MILTTFFGVTDGDPKQLQLEQVPRTGDEITLNSGTTYRVTSVRWQLTSAGMRDAGLEVEVVPG